MNLRPSGYEPDELPDLAYPPVPSSTSEVGFRAFDVPVRTTADQPIPARGVEASVEASSCPRSPDLGHSSFAEHRRGCLSPGTFLDARLEKVDDFDDAFGAKVWSTLGGVDPAEVGAAVELSQP